MIVGKSLLECWFCPQWSMVATASWNFAKGIAIVIDTFHINTFHSLRKCWLLQNCFLVRSKNSYHAPPPCLCTGFSHCRHLGHKAKTGQCHQLNDANWWKAHRISEDVLSPISIRHWKDGHAHSQALTSGHWEAQGTEFFPWCEPPAGGNGPELTVVSAKSWNAPVDSWPTGTFFWVSQEYNQVLVLAGVFLEAIFVSLAQCFENTAFPFVEQPSQIDSLPRLHLSVRDNSIQHLSFLFERFQPTKQ